MGEKLYENCEKCLEYFESMKLFCLFLSKIRRHKTTGEFHFSLCDFGFLHHCVLWVTSVCVTCVSDIYVCVVMAVIGHQVGVGREENEIKEKKRKTRKRRKNTSRPMVFNHRTQHCMLHII